MRKLTLLAVLSLSVAAWAQGGRYGSPPTPGTDTGRRAEPSAQAASGPTSESAKKANGKVERHMGRANEGQGASAAAPRSHPASAPKGQP